jgi:hypothetical protein
MNVFYWYCAKPYEAPTEKNTRKDPVLSQALFHIDDIIKFYHTASKQTKDFL